MAAPKKDLATVVYVRDRAGEIKCFAPGDVIPAWAKKAIKNPKAWVEAAEETPDDSTPADPTGDTTGDSTGDGDLGDNPGTDS